MQDRLSRFEAHIQRLVEGGFARLFAGCLHPREVAIRLAYAMEDHTLETDNGRHLAPDIYIVRLHPLDHAAILKDQPTLADTLATELVEMARNADLTLVDKPEVRLLTDNSINQKEISIGALHSSNRIQTTRGLPVKDLNLPPFTPNQATLIVNGDRHIPLDKALINIGRHRDNHLILNDLRVSRHHAQLRVRSERYTIFDLDSSSGLWVNGYQVREAALQSGDVIKLGGTSLIYVEEKPPADSTQPAPKV